MPLSIQKKLIAPCGMNCALCIARQRLKNACNGCRKLKDNEPVSRLNCRIRNCDERNDGYCFNCNKYPCRRLRQLDKRYRTKYGMSEIENLEYIRDNGIREFLKKEIERWVKDREIFCVHDKKYYPVRKNGKSSHDKK